MFRIIVARDLNRGIGFQNQIPWEIDDDIKHFRTITTKVKKPEKKNCVIMGRLTYQSIPKKHRPLKNRINIVLSSTMEPENDVVVFNNIGDILKYVEENKKLIETCYVIGGSDVYRTFLENNLVSVIYETLICHSFSKIDRHMPVFEDNFELQQNRLVKLEDKKKNKVYKVYFKKYTYKNEAENKYLDLMNKILVSGIERTDRTGVGTYSLFAETLKYDISDGKLPLLTTKFVPIRFIIEELLWFISGSTDARKLQEKGIPIWNGNTTREFLDSRGLTHLPEGDIGAGYGHQLRHFNAPYITCENFYQEKGFDQLKYVIDLLRHNPDSRRILFSYWNPQQLNDAALPPCFLENTQVLTKEGYKNIQDIEEGDFLFTHKNNIQRVNKKYITNYTGEIYELNIDGIPRIYTTPDHPFYVRNVIYKNNPKLKMIECSEPDWVKSKDLNNNSYFGIKINDNQIIPEFIIKNGLNKTKTIEIKKILNNKDEWYLFGYYLGDGWSRWDRNGTFYLFFNKRDEEELKNKFSNICKTFRLNRKQKGCNVYEYHSYELSYILKMFGKKAHNKIIPNWVLDTPNEFLDEFIKGYIRADGCHYKNNGNIHTSIITTSKDIAFKTQLILLKQNIFSSIVHQKRPKKCYIEGRCVNQKDTYHIDIIFNRKRQIRSFIKDGYAWFPIKKINIKKYENTNVYNFDVEEDHTYIVNNICVHNCHLLYQFYVNPKTKEISSCLYQRSSDYFLANNYNAVSAIILTYMLGQVCGYKPKEFTHFMGDTHIYKNHFEQCKKQLRRTPHIQPTINLNKNIKNIEDFTYEDFRIVNYFPQQAIRGKMN